ncbi:MAG TPA: TetR/AcrR family transcriptional regulator [Egibacteraceae bacterium]|nr:TetR/AcrR family transcriptional regulator [Egibacteraceae bacterium]
MEGVATFFTGTRVDAASRRESRRRQLLDAADRVIRRDGPSASMDSIAAEAGITKPILYRHFGDKGELYRMLAERYVEPVMGALMPALTQAADARTRLRAAVDVYLAFIEAEPQIYRFLMHPALGEQQEARATVSDFVLRVGREVGAAIGEELERKGLDTAPAGAWGHGIVGMVQVAGDWWLREGTMPRAELVDHLSALAWHGLCVLGNGPGRDAAT